VQRVALHGENADFWPLDKFNTGSLLLCRNAAVKMVGEFAVVVLHEQSLIITLPQ